MGRPAFNVTDEFLRQLETAAGLGLTNERICGLLGLHHTTLNKLMHRDERVKLAITKGKGEASFTVSKALFTRCKEGDVPAIKWFESTRDGRAEKSETNVKAVVATAEDELKELEAARLLLEQHGIDVE